MQHDEFMMTSLGRGDFDGDLQMKNGNSKKVVEKLYYFGNTTGCSILIFVILFLTGFAVKRVWRIFFLCVKNKEAEPLYFLHLPRIVK